MKNSSLAKLILAVALGLGWGCLPPALAAAGERVPRSSAAARPEAAPIQVARPILSESYKADLARAIGKQLFPADQIKASKVKVNHFFAYKNWSIIYVDNSYTDPPFLFYSGNPLTTSYVTSWSGDAMDEDKPIIKNYVLKNAPGIPSELASWFAWYVTEGQAAEARSRQAAKAKIMGLPLPLVVRLAAAGKSPKQADEQGKSESFRGSTSAQTVKGNDPLPLRHGFYYPEDVKCPKPGEYVPDIVGGLLYDGKDCVFNQHHVEAALVTVRTNGNTYYMTRRCAYNGGKANGGADYIDSMTIIIKSNTSFIWLHDAECQKLRGKKETVYRWCGDEKMQMEITQPMK